METFTPLIAKHIRDVHFGGNWTCSNLEEILSDVTLDEALQQIYGLNSIATLTFHIHYYTVAITNVLEGLPLEAKDEYSFAHPSFEKDSDWKEFIANVLDRADAFSHFVAKLKDEQLITDFTDEKYGNYFRNLIGFVEHTHYHLGQIALIKKIIRAQSQ